MPRITMKSTSAIRYESPCGMVMQREYGKTPNGNDIDGRWVLRGADGEMIDFDQYRNDIADRYNLNLEEE